MWPAPEIRAPSKGERDPLRILIKILPSFEKKLWSSILISLLATLLLLLYAPEARELCLGLVPIKATEPALEIDQLTREIQKLQRSTKRLQNSLISRSPRGPYLIISTTENKFYLNNGSTLVREGICSTGSYIHLKANNEREWLFETPRGVYHILSKTRNPVWTKPDWAFVEEGLPIPPAGSALRYERGVLGDYALGLGNGYLLHGTLYQRLLGLPVTHGCIRLGDEDLAIIYHTLNLGAPVYIY